MNLVIAPNLASFRYVAGLGGIDASQDADAFAMLRILACGDVNSILVKDRGGVDFARPLRGWILDRFAILDLVVGRIAIVLPHRFEKTAITLLDWFGIKRIAVSISAAEKDQLAAIDFACRRRTP